MDEHGNPDDKESSSDDDNTQFDSGQKERKAHYPDTGYNVIRIDLTEPLGSALTKLRHSSRLSSINLRSATAFEDYVVYDAHGQAYGQETLNEIDVSADSTQVENVLEMIRSGDSRDRRIAFLHLAAIAEDDPKACLSTVPQLTSEIESSEPAIQAEALNVLSLIAAEYPTEVRPSSDVVFEFLTPDTDPTVLADAISIVAAIAEQEPDAVVDAVPKLAALLQDDLVRLQS